MPFVLSRFSFPSSHLFLCSMYCCHPVHVCKKIVFVRVCMKSCTVRVCVSLQFYDLTIVSSPCLYENDVQ